MTRTKQRVLFMHTIDGKPASFRARNGQVTFASARHLIPLAESLAQIKREQAATKAYRVERGFSDVRFEYGYVRVEVPHASR